MKPHQLLIRVTALTTGILALAFLSAEAAAADSVRPEISFQVHKLREENVEGPDVERNYFIAAGKRIVFGEPKDCRFSVDGDGVTLLPKDIDLDGQINVSRSSFTPDFTLTDNALIYREAAAKSLPNGATKVTVEQPMLDPYPYNGWKSLGFTWTYALNGRSMVRNVSYINLRVGVQIMVTTLAAKKDAEKVTEIANRFMRSWWAMASP